MKKSCGIFIYHKPTNEILLGRNTNHTDWSIPKGTQEQGEKDLKTALREVYEESNVDINFLKKFKTYDLGFIKYKNKDWGMTSYLTLCDEKPKNIKCNSYFDFNGKKLPEFDKLKWVKLDDILSGIVEIQEAQLRKIKEFKKFL